MPTYDGINGSAGAVPSGQAAPWWLDTLESWPSMKVSAGFAAFRGSNTILRGGWAKDFNEAHNIRRPITRVRNPRGGLPSLHRGHVFQVGSSGEASLFRTRRSRRTPHSLRSNNPFDVRAWSQFGSADIFHPGLASGKAEGVRYSPFQGSSVLNWAGRKTGLQASLGTNVVTGGLFGQISAAKMAEKGLTAGQAANAARYAERVGGGLSLNSVPAAVERIPFQPQLSLRYTSNVEAIGGLKPGQVFQVGTRGAQSTRIVTAGEARTFIAPGPGREASLALRSAAPGFINQAVGGALHGAKYGMEGMEAAWRAHGPWGALSRSTFHRTGQWAARGLAEVGLEGGVKSVGLRTATKMGMKRAYSQGGVKLAAKVAPKIALAAADGPLPFLDTVAAVWMAYDISKMTKPLIQGAINTVGDAYKSLQGNIGTAPLGGGIFKDTEAASTARSRGVMAIQNSRLNARSTLGSEAGMMAQHFG